MRRKTAWWRVPALALAISAALVAVYAAIVLIHLMPWRVRYWQEIKAGNAIAANVEKFRKQSGRLPNPSDPAELVALGFELRTAGYHPDYRLDGSEYVIAYYSGFDGPYLNYSSARKDWKCDLC